MATYIRVEGGDQGALLERNKAEQAASRARRIEDERDAAVTSKASTARAEKLAEGDPTDRLGGDGDGGGPGSGDTPRRPGAAFIRREPVRGKPGANKKQRLQLAAVQIIEKVNGMSILSPSGLFEQFLPPAIEPFSSPYTYGVLAPYQSESGVEGGGSYLRSWNKLYWTETGGDSAYFSAVLPAGGETLIVVFASAWNLAMAYSGYDVKTTTYTYDTVYVYSPRPKIVTEYLVPVFSSILETRSGSRTSCFAVGPNFCKAISTPSALAQKLEPFLTIGGPKIWQEITPFASGEGVTLEGEDPPGAIYSVNRVRVQNVPERPNFGAGYSFIRNYYSSFVTPGVYEFLDNPSMLLEDEPPYELQENDAWVRANYFSDAPKPLDGLYLDWDKITANASTNPGTYTITKRGRPGPRYLASTYPNHSRFYYAWDWGRPEYCRRKLFDLGFRPEDLAP